MVRNKTAIHISIAVLILSSLSCEQIVTEVQRMRMPDTCVASAWLNPQVVPLGETTEQRTSAEEGVSTVRTCKYKLILTNIRGDRPITPLIHEGVQGETMAMVRAWSAQSPLSPGQSMTWEGKVVVRVGELDTYTEATIAEKFAGVYADKDCAGKESDKTFVDLISRKVPQTPCSLPAEEAAHSGPKGPAWDKCDARDYLEVWAQHKQNLSWESGAKRCEYVVTLRNTSSTRMIMPRILEWDQEAYDGTEKIEWATWRELAPGESMQWDGDVSTYTDPDAQGRPGFNRIKLISAIWAEPACEAVWYDDAYSDNSGFEVPQDPCPVP